MGTLSSQYIGGAESVGIVYVSFWCQMSSWSNIRIILDWLSYDRREFAFLCKLDGVYLLSLPSGEFLRSLESSSPSGSSGFSLTS